MAVPLYDMTSVILIRLSEGRSPFKGDRRHFSHRLVARGLTIPRAVWTIDLVTLAGGAGALLAAPARRPGCVCRRCPDLLPARGRGHSRTGGEPYGRGKWPDAALNSPAPLMPRSPERPGSRIRACAPAEPHDSAPADGDSFDLLRRAASARRTGPHRGPDHRAGILPQRAQPQGRGRRRPGLGPARLRYGRHRAGGPTPERPPSFSLLGDRCVRRRPDRPRRRSATHSLDRRPAINLAWEWVALGFVYLLLRNLPRTRNESSALAAALGRHRRGRLRLWSLSEQGRAPRCFRPSSSAIPRRC